MSLERSPRRLMVLVAALSFLPPAAAHAQPAEAPAAPAPAPAAPAAPAPAPAMPPGPPAPPPEASPPQPGDGTELPSLPPSPLLSSDDEAAGDPVASDRDPRALSEFRGALDAYGTWVAHPTYGTVWVPRQDVVGQDFAPYVSSGHWALGTDGAWIWVSDYPFGWVVFHYGRWARVSGVGWVWIPGYRYAPAWVTWRVPVGSYAYVGWAPLGPEFVWFGGVAYYYGWGYSLSWVFCPSVYVFHRHPYAYYVRDPATVHRLAAGTRRYISASPRAASPVAARRVTPSAPSLRAARVPARSLPAERLPSRSRPAPSPGVTRSRAPSRLPGLPPRRLEPDRDAPPPRSGGRTRPRRHPSAPDGTRLLHPPAPPPTRLPHGAGSERSPHRSNR